MQLRDLHYACGGMAAYAVIFAAEISTHGRTDVETVIISSDNCLLASMGFDMKETGIQAGYQIGAGVFEALAKEKSLQRSACCIIPLCKCCIIAMHGRMLYKDMSAPIYKCSQLWHAMHDLVLGLQCEDSGDPDSTALPDLGSSSDVAERGNLAKIEP